MSALDQNELIALARRVDESTFVKKRAGLYLIIRGAPGDAPQADIRETARVERSGSTPPPEPRFFTIVPVVRRGQTPFADMVSVGRTDANDIVLRHGTVSKLHAYFAEGDDGWTLTDQGSTNGTWVGGVRLMPNEPRRLTGTEMLAFGQVHVALKEARALWRFLDLERRTA